MQTLKKINLGRAVIFLFLYLVLLLIIYLYLSLLFTTTFFILKTIFSEIPQVAYSFSFISLLDTFGFIFTLAIPLVSYLIVYLLTLTKFKVFKFKLSERFLGFIVIPFIFTLILAIWFSREVTYNPSSFDNANGPPIGLLFGPIIIVLIPVMQIFIFTFWEVVILLLRKIKKI